MGIKVAFAGKGGVGKTTLAGLFINALASDGIEVLAVDCDPLANLGRFLGIKDADKITPIVEMKELIDERTEVSPDRTFYKLNPKVDDIPEKFAKKLNHIRLMVMGTVRAGGSGCMCPESSFLKALFNKILLEKNESVVMDMEAGIEHLGRGTASFVDTLFVVTEPTLSSITAAKKIISLAKDIKIKEILVILNKIRKSKDVELVKEKILPHALIGSIPFEENLLDFANDQLINLEKTQGYATVLKIKNKILKKEQITYE